MQDLGGGQWACNACGNGQPTYRYIMSAQLGDHTGSEYVTIFDAEATQLLGESATALHDIVEQGSASGSVPPEFDAVIQRATFRCVRERRERVRGQREGGWEQQQWGEERERVGCAVSGELPAAPIAFVGDRDATNDLQLNSLTCRISDALASPLLQGVPVHCAGEDGAHQGGEAAERHGGEDHPHQLSQGVQGAVGQHQEVPPGDVSDDTRSGGGAAAWAVMTRMGSDVRLRYSVG